jgi:death on curing protein
VIASSEILKILKTLIDSFGGSQGVRDMSVLESALARPFQKYDNKDLYGTTIEKAAALVESLLVNHPFVDGNKRTGYTALRLYLMQNGLDFNNAQSVRYDFIISIASGQLKYDGILSWLAQNVEEHKGA